MKRINPQTNKPFSRGDIRDDGKLFKRYNEKIIKKNGFFLEEWVSTKNFYNLESSKNDYLKNKNRYAKKAKLWKSKNKDWVSSYRAKKRADKLLRMPKWLSKIDKQRIKQIYGIAKKLTKITGEQYHVDHIVPLKGEFVSGLHVPWNLHAIPAVKNLEKSNKF